MAVWLSTGAPDVIGKVRGLLTPDIVSQGGLRFFPVLELPFLPLMPPLNVVRVRVLLAGRRVLLPCFPILTFPASFSSLPSSLL